MKASLHILGAGAYLPERTVGNNDICDAEHAQWAATRIGVLERRVSGVHETTAAMGAAAGIEALKRADLRPEDIDVLFLATATPDQPIPPSVFEMASLIGLPSVPAFEVHAVCTGFLSAAICASQFLAAGGARTALVVGADRFTSITDWGHRDRVYFGDGAGAVILAQGRGEANFFSVLHYESRPHLFFRNEAAHFMMDSSGLRRFGVEKIPSAILSLLQGLNVSPSDINLVISHQASGTMLTEILSAVGIEGQLLMSNIETVGNTAAASIPLLIEKAQREGRLTSGCRVLLFAIGAGMSWGASVYIAP